ncbi:MAG: DUF2147 domain-containing protein [Devosia sp.]
MKLILSWFAALFISILALSPALAGGVTPVGKWQVATGEARYVVTSCGKGGTLCAKLVWLSPDARTDENLALLNTYVVTGAQPSGANIWSGSVVMNGKDYAGTMTLVSGNLMRLKGCSGILCQTYEFTRI